MGMIAALMLAQAGGAIGTVPTRTPELDAAHACLVKGVEQLLSDGRPRSTPGDQWYWAVTIVNGCKVEIYAAADSPEAVVVLPSDAHGSGITKRQMLYSESLYHVDRLIREHFEAKGQ